jgi:nucleoside-diphosphate-sugar epimerase
VQRRSVQRRRRRGHQPSRSDHAAGTGRVTYVEWPAAKKAIDIGSFYADSTKFKTATGWAPTVPLAEGLRRAVEFYRAHRDQYVGGESEPART